MNIKDKINLLKKSIKEANEIITDANKQIKTIQSECNHEDIKVNSCDSADCNICGKYFYNYCPTSPTLECNYEQEDGSYDEECCIYCGLPEERK